MGAGEAEAKSVMKMMMEIQKEACEIHVALKQEICDNRAVFDDWRPQMEKYVNQLQLVAPDMQEHLKISTPEMLKMPFRLGEAAADEGTTHRVFIIGIPTVAQE
jgi:hypothetical protein